MFEVHFCKYCNYCVAVVIILQTPTSSLKINPCYGYQRVRTGKQKHLRVLIFHHHHYQPQDDPQRPSKSQLLTACIQREPMTFIKPSIHLTRLSVRFLSNDYHFRTTTVVKFVRVVFDESGCYIWYGNGMV